MLKSLLECFKNSETFILNFWKGIEYIAKNLVEKAAKEKMNNTFARRSTLMTESTLGKLQDPTNPLFRVIFCTAIMQNIGKIKNQVLFFANQIMLILFENPEQMIIPKKINVLEFFLNFIRNTGQESVIIKACHIINDWKEKWPSLWYRSDFNMSLEESISFLKFYTKYLFF